jgi:hypothetical protein
VIRRIRNGQGENIDLLGGKLIANFRERTWFVVEEDGNLASGLHAAIERPGCHREQSQSAETAARIEV